MAGTVDFTGIQADEPVNTVSALIAGHMVRGTPEAIAALKRHWQTYSTSGRVDGRKAA